MKPETETDAHDDWDALFEEIEVETSKREKAFSTKFGAVDLKRWREERKHTFPCSKRGLAPSSIPDEILIKLLDLCVVKMGLAIHHHSEGDVVSDNFQELRAKYNSISMELNSRGRLAPYHRPRIPAPIKTFRSKADNLHAIDLQVIDLHWLHIHGKDEGTCGVTTRSIFKGGLFSINDALNFAAQPWPASKKVLALQLDLFDEWSLAVLHSPEVPCQMRKLKKERSVIIRKLRSMSRRDARYTKRMDDWPTLWVARKIAGYTIGMKTVCDSDKIPAKLIANVYGNMTGTEPSRQNISTRVHRLMLFNKNTL